MRRGRAGLSLRRWQRLGWEDGRKKAPSAGGSADAARSAGLSAGV